MYCKIFRFSIIYISWILHSHFYFSSVNGKEPGVTCGYIVIINPPISHQKFKLCCDLQIEILNMALEYTYRHSHILFGQIDDWLAEGQCKSFQTQGSG